MKVTQAQLDALFKVYLRWQDKTEHAIMPEEFTLVPDDEYRVGDCIGVWVGTPDADRDKTDKRFNRFGSMYLGIEHDGYTHS